MADTAPTTRRRWFQFGFASSLIAITVIAISCVLITNLWPQPNFHQYSTRWSAGSISNPSGNDIWIEYSGLEASIMFIYRDFDGDGIIDEKLVPMGPSIVVERSTKRDGVLDNERDTSEPWNLGIPIRANQVILAPTAKELDELAKRRPIGDFYK